MPLFKKKEGPKVSPERLQKSIPVINPEIKYEEDSEGIVTVMIPVRTGDAKQAIRTMKIKLDIIGSKVWKKIDGKTTLSGIAEWMKNEFKITEREAEVSLSMFIRSLIEKRLVALILPPPRPGTPEVQEEIQRIKTEVADLEKAYRKKKIDEKTYKALKEKYEEAIEEFLKREKTAGKTSDQA
jgi:hypothetical protein